MKPRRFAAGCPAMSQWTMIFFRLFLPPLLSPYSIARPPERREMVLPACLGEGRRGGQKQRATTLHDCMTA
ncbi:hypothetical protein QBC46DRAFT_385422 [Diplogelasinospora grovesii]|uniref:Secreted protein n=1 Tax=Diplogelasinospora grovesii TaxID=303347 RepID=A0AAN6NAY5_9PEZI|nr:hypothetical protein QBC46DRAFT_385422 [Diplogelasinospora grovesii]